VISWSAKIGSSGRRPRDPCWFSRRRRERMGNPQGAASTSARLSGEHGWMVSRSWKQPAVTRHRRPVEAATDEQIRHNVALTPHRSKAAKGENVRNPLLQRNPKAGYSRDRPAVPSGFFGGNLSGHPRVWIVLEARFWRYIARSASAGIGRSRPRSPIVRPKRKPARVRRRNDTRSGRMPGAGPRPSGRCPRGPYSTGSPRTRRPRVRATKSDARTWVRRPRSPSSEPES